MNPSKIVIIVIIIAIVYLVVQYYGNRVSEAKLDESYMLQVNQAQALDRDNTDYEEESEDTESSMSSFKSNNNNGDNDEKVENFQASGLGNPVIDQGTLENAYALLSLSTTSGGKDSMSERLIVHQIKSTEFLELIKKLKTIISDIIVKYATSCMDMNGSEVLLGDGKQTLTLSCVSDPFSIQEEIIHEIYNYLYKYTEDKFHVHLNPYMTYHDLYQNLNLMEGVIYPLSNSGLYTVHGIQYTTERWIRHKVDSDIEVRHALMTIYSRRGIEIELNTDQQIY